MKNKIISLSNRYGDKNYLEQVDEHMYILHIDPKAADCYRLGLKEGRSWEDREYEFVDPSGGPFIRVDNYEIDGKVVKYIYEAGGNIILEV